MSNVIRKRYCLLHGDVKEALKNVNDCSIDCCITSPPYFNLRKYEDTARWVGGSASCGHEDVDGDECRLCGARLVDLQIGMEKTPKEFIDSLVESFREVRRVLKKEGTLWVNIGDSYCSVNGFARSKGKYARNGSSGCVANGRDVTALHQAGYKTKDLMGIPWMLAFALREDGWYLRQDIVWEKTDPMPDNMNDRLNRSHEFLFLLAKSRKYYFDVDAIRDPPYTGSRKKDVWHCAVQTMHGDHQATFPEKLIEPCVLAGCPRGGTVLDCFCGSSTTGVVAMKNGRRFIGVDLSGKYIGISDERLSVIELIDYGL